jgi:hypothetical protein
LAKALSLPAVPLPGELLRSVFARFAATRTVLVVREGAPSSADGTLSKTTMKQVSLRGVPFAHLPSALAAAGCPVAPAESRELFRYLGLALAESADEGAFSRAYAALAGFRWLATSGLLSEGSDMLDVSLAQAERTAGGQVSGLMEDGDDASDLSDEEAAARPQILSPAAGAGLVFGDGEEEGGASPLSPGGGGGGALYESPGPRMGSLDAK